MANLANLPERKDADGDWHQVMHDVCYWCGCHYLYAEDDHDLVWEPGPTREKACSDDDANATSPPSSASAATERTSPTKSLHCAARPPFR